MEREKLVVVTFQRQHQSGASLRVPVPVPGTIVLPRSYLPLVLPHTRCHHHAHAQTWSISCDTMYTCATMTMYSCTPHRAASQPLSASLRGRAVQPYTACTHCTMAWRGTIVHVYTTVHSRVHTRYQRYSRLLPFLKRTLTSASTPARASPLPIARATRPKRRRPPACGTTAHSDSQRGRPCSRLSSGSCSRVWRARLGRPR